MGGKCTFLSDSKSIRKKMCQKMRRDAKRISPPFVHAARYQIFSGITGQTTHPLWCSLPIKQPLPTQANVSSVEVIIRAPGSNLVSSKMTTKIIQPLQQNKAIPMKCGPAGAISLNKNASGANDATSACTALVEVTPTPESAGK